MIDSVCTCCGFELRSGNAARGKVLPCPKCRTPIVIGGEAAPAPPPPTSARPLVELRAKYNADTLVVSCSESLASVGEWVLATLAKSPGLGERTTTQIGSIPVVLLRRGRELWLCEPDLLRPGVVRQWNVRDAIALLALTEMVHEAARVPVTKVPMNGVVVQFRDSIASAGVFLRHDSPSESAGDTGWWLQDLRDVDDRELQLRSNLVATTVYELYAARPALLSVMALPVGWVGLFDKHELKKVLGPGNRVVLQA